MASLFFGRGPASGVGMYFYLSIPSYFMLSFHKDSILLGNRGAETFFGAWRIDNKVEKHVNDI